MIVYILDNQAESSVSPAKAKPLRIRTEIVCFAPMSPRSARERIPGWLKGTLATAGLAILVFALISLIGREIREADKDVRGDLASIKIDLAILLRANTNAKNLPSLLQSIASGSNDELKATLPLAIELLKTAQQRGVIVDPKDITNVGQALFGRVDSVPAPLSLTVWETGKYFIEYRSFLNAKLNPSPSLPPSFQPFDPPDIKLTIENSLFENASLDLSNKVLQNVTFIRSTITYSGGPVTLDKVQFFDCHFFIKLTTKGKQIAPALLTDTPTVQL